MVDAVAEVGQLLGEVPHAAEEVAGELQQQGLRGLGGTKIIS